MNLSPEMLAKVLALEARDRPSARVQLPRPEPADEAEFQGQVIALAVGLGYRVYHTHNSRRSEPGFPDLFICGHGRSMFAELKTRTGVVSPEQEAWLEDIRAARTPAYVWRPADWSVIERVLMEGRQ